jgi:hypothetical protein
VRMAGVGMLPVRMRIGMRCVRMVDLLRQRGASNGEPTRQHSRHLI